MDDLSLICDNLFIMCYFLLLIYIYKKKSDSLFLSLNFFPFLFQVINQLIYACIKSVFFFNLRCCNSKAVQYFFSIMKGSEIKLKTFN